MSDLFNTGKGKATFASILRNEDFKPGQEFPDYWKPVESVELPNKPRMKDLSKSLLRRGIPVFKTRAIPKMIQLASSTLINPSLSQIMIPGAKLHDMVSFPGGDEEFIPTYLTANWYVENYDRPLLKQISYRYITLGNEQSFGNIMHMEPQLDFIRLLWSSIETTAYGNGSLIGQVERLATMWAVKRGKDGYNAAKPLIDAYHMTDKTFPLETLATMFERYLPLGSVETLTHEGGWVGLIHRPSKYLQPLDPNDPDGEEYDWFPPMRAASSSGLPYLGKTKGETVTEALVLADQFALKINEIMRSTIGAGPRKKTGDPNAWKKLVQALEDYWYLSCGLEFPKGERYSKEKWHTKTRNIWSASFPTHIIMSLISYPAMMTSPNCLTFDTPSLYGFTPFHGGANKFVEKLILAKESTSFIYADNYYILHVDKKTKIKTWYSLDLVRGESQTTVQDCQLLAYYLLTRAHVTQDGKPAFSAAWAYIALMIIPTLCVDSSGLIGNVQFQIPGQGSGNSWTFLLNHLKVSLFDFKWSKMMRGLNDRPTDESFNELCKQMGMNFTVERVIEDFEVALLDARDQTEKDFTTCYLSGDDNPPSSPPVNIELDLLGWSIVWDTASKRWIPVLEAKRLAESTILPKGSSERATNEESYVTQQCYMLARMEAARLVGAWQYWPVDIALRERSNEIRETLLRKGVGVKSIERSMKKALENLELAEAIGEDDITLHKRVDHTSFLNLFSGIPTMTSQQQNAMEHRTSWTYETQKSTLSDIMTNPDGSLILKPYLKKIVEILGGLSHLEVQNRQGAY